MPAISRRPTKVRKNRNPARRLKNDPNPVIPCACGCGQTRLAFDTAGRPKRYIAGHFRATGGGAAAPADGVREEVLGQLRAGRTSPQEIAAKLGRSRNSVSIALTRLRAEGRAERVAKATWRAVAAPAAPGEGAGPSGETEAAAAP